MDNVNNTPVLHLMKFQWHRGELCEYKRFSSAVLGISPLAKIIHRVNPSNRLPRTTGVSSLGGSGSDDKSRQGPSRKLLKSVLSRSIKRSRGPCSFSPDKTRAWEFRETEQSARCWRLKKWNTHGGIVPRPSLSTSFPRKSNVSISIFVNQVSGCLFH